MGGAPKDRNVSGWLAYAVRRSRPACHTRNVAGNDKRKPHLRQVRLTIPKRTRELTTEIEHALTLVHPHNSEIVINDYTYTRGGRFRRRGKRDSTEIGTGTQVQVRVWVSDTPKRRLKASKAHLVASHAHEMPPCWECPNCGERIPPTVEYINGHKYDTSPDNLRWVADVDGRLWHQEKCIENMMGRAWESDEDCPNSDPRWRDAYGFPIRRRNRSLSSSLRALFDVDDYEDYTADNEPQNDGFYEWYEKKEQKIRSLTKDGEYTPDEGRTCPKTKMIGKLG